MALTSEGGGLAFTLAYELIQMIKSKRLSPVEPMEAIFREIEGLNPRLNAYLFDFAANPAAGVSCGFSSDGLAIGLQIVDRLEDEVTVLRALVAFEKARPWANKRPAVS